jgi:ABC-2 type transport system ATP-binding protein
MLCGLLQPDSGSVLLHGKAIRNGDPQTKAKVGVCPQNIVVWEKLTCLEQLVFLGALYDLSHKQAKQNALRLLEDLDLLEKQNKQAGTLSGGMKRRLNIAMALVHDPQIIVFDEPEAGLDPQSRVKVREYIQSLALKKTVILTTHNMDEAERLADRVAIIDHGQLLVLDTPQGLKERLGQGDTLEIKILNPSPNLMSLPTKLSGFTQEIHLDTSQQLLQIRVLNAVSVLSPILEQLTAEGVCPGEVRIRPNTLEDVFIQLTGRRLRE